MTERSRSGKTAWDKEKTRELFRRYKETGDPDAREQLVMSHMNLVRFLANKFRTAASRSTTSCRSVSGFAQGYRPL